MEKNVQEWYDTCGGEDFGISLAQASIVWDAAWDAAMESFKLEREIKDVEDDLDVIIGQQCVIRFHDAVCDQSHTDQCGWLYEIKNGKHQWDQPSHMSWIAKYKTSKANNFKGCFEKVPYKE